MPSPNLNAEQIKRHQEALKGNKFGCGLKTPEAKQKAYESYCAKIASGYPKKSWYYRDDEGNHCSWETMEKLIKQNEFDLSLYEDAYAKSFEFLYGKGMRYTDNEKCGNAQVRAWEFIMKMRHGEEIPGTILHARANLEKDEENATKTFRPWHAQEDQDGDDQTE